MLDQSNLWTYVLDLDILLYIVFAPKYRKEAGSGRNTRTEYNSK